MLPSTSLRRLDRLLRDEHGLLRVLPASALREVPWMMLRMYAHVRAIYTFPTVELLEAVRPLLRGRAIEVGAGHGAIARGLGIPATDSYMQTSHEMRLFYAMLKAPVVEPAADVVKFDALEAVHHYQPDTVLGAFITQLWKCDADTEASIYGVDEEVMLQRVSRYIMVGNDGVHGKKRILARPHQVIRAPWIVTRCEDQEKNAIYVWG